MLHSLAGAATLVAAVGFTALVVGLDRLRGCPRKGARVRAATAVPPAGRDGLIELGSKS